MCKPTLIFFLIVSIQTVYLSDLPFKNNVCTKLSSYPIADHSPHCYYNEDVFSDIKRITKRHNYNLESHKVTTDDGYILTLFRIGSPKTKITRNPVLIQHGISSSAIIWVYTGNRSLAFNLADMGYDVWLGNFRGTSFSYEHSNLTTLNSKYWNFTIDTLAKYDLPAKLTFIANITRQGGKIIYLGHSMGTSVGFMYASESKENLVEKYLMMAPVAYMHGQMPLEMLIPIARPAFKILEDSNVKGLFFQENFIKKILAQTCQRQPQLCLLALDVLFGQSGQFPAEDLLLYFNYWPSGASVYQYHQYVQIAASKKFQKFDYGLEGNKAEYGAEQPPAYNLSKITRPVYLFYGKKDTLNNKNLVTKLYNELGSTKKTIFSIPQHAKFAFNHINFFHSRTIKEDFYLTLFSVL